MSTQTNGTVTALPLPSPAVPDEPVPATTGSVPGDVQEMARQAYRQSLADEKPLSGKALGEMFERGERWGRDRVAEVKNGTSTTTAVKATPRPAPAAKTTSTSGGTAKPAERQTGTMPARQPEQQTTDATPAAVPAPAGGRLVSWVGFVFGSVMSVAANVLYTWLPAAVMPAGWSPGIAPQVGAAVWPIGLLLSVEVLSRVQWRAGWAWGLARYGGAGTVSLGSAVISYGHLRDVLIAWGYGPLAAHVGPLVLDGLMVISGFALLAMSGGRKADPA